MARTNTGRAKRDQGGVQSPRVDTNELFRRLENTVRIGEVIKANYKKGKVRVRIGDEKSDDKIETHWIPWTTSSAANNREFNPPEVGEQVTVFAPSGDMRNAFVGQSIAKKTDPHEANDPRYYKQTYRSTKKGSKKKEFAAMVEFDRDTGTYRHHIKESGSFRFEIGGKACLIFNKDHIQLQVGKTQIVLKEDNIKALVKGGETSMEMGLKDITHQVKGASVMQLTDKLIGLSHRGMSQLVMTAANVALGMPTMKVGIQMASGVLKNMVGSSIMNLTKQAATLFGGASGFTLSGAIKMLSPKFDGFMGVHPPGIFDLLNFVLPKNIIPHTTLKPPTVAKMVLPEMPDEGGSKGEG